MEVRRVDPDDDEALAAYTAIMDASDRFQDEYAVPFTMVDLRERLRNIDSSYRAEGYLGLDDGLPVAVGNLKFWMVDNLEKVWVYVDVPPGERNRGHGTAMLDFVVDRARAESRTTLITSANYPFDADESHPYRRFLTGRGFVLSQSDVHRVLDLPADGSLLDRLAKEAAPYHADYTFVDYTGLVPEAIREAYCVLLNHIFVDAPSGDLEFEEGRITPEILVEQDELTRAAGRLSYATVALDHDGVPVAHNVLNVPLHDPEKVFNQDTLVRRDHRGHRLGLAVKIRNLQRVTALHPDRTVVHTWNAESNAPMIAVNDAMGFRPVTYGGEYARTL